MNFIAASAIIIILVGITTLSIGSIRYFFPFVEAYIPEGFKRPLSSRYAAYYLLTGMLLLLLLPSP